MVLEIYAKKSKNYNTVKAETKLQQRTKHHYEYKISLMRREKQQENSKKNHSLNKNRHHKNNEGIDLEKHFEETKNSKS